MFSSTVGSLSVHEKMYLPTLEYRDQSLKYIFSKTDNESTLDEVHLILQPIFIVDRIPRPGTYLPSSQEGGLRTEFEKR